MATTSTIAIARQALVDLLDTGALAGNVYYAWPGGDVGERNEILWIDRIAPGTWTQEIPNIKAGRMQRHENYTFELVLWVAQPERNADGSKAAFERAVELAEVVENKLADDVTIGEQSLKVAVLESRDVDEVAFDRGRAVQLVMSINCQARLT
jgi:DNA-binding protein